MGLEKGWACGEIGSSEQVSREVQKVGLREGRRGAAQLGIKVTIKDGQQCHSIRGILKSGL